MLFDSLLMHAVTHNLAEHSRGLRVLRVFQTSRFEIVIDLAHKTPPGQLVLSCCPQFGRIHLDEGHEPDPTVSYPTGSVLRRWLKSAVLVNIEQRQFDRAVRLEFANARGLGPQAHCFIVLEVMGNHSNLIVLDEDKVILEAVKHIGADRNRIRQIEPGLDYVPPPSFGRLRPDALSVQELFASATDPQTSATKWFRATVQGASDQFRDEALARADIAGDARVGDLASPDFEHLVTALQEMLTESRQGAWSYACPDKDFAYPIMLQSCPDCRPEAATTIHQAVARMANQQIEANQSGELRRRLLQATARARNVVAKRVAERDDMQHRAEDADELRINGEAILTALHTIPRGSSHVTLANPYDYGNTLEVHLSPKLSAQANAQAYFKRYKKLISVKERVTRLLRDAKRERHYLDGLEVQIEQAEGLTELDELREELAQQGYLKRGQERKQRLSGHAKIKSATVSGHVIMWGKSGLQNDELLRKAGPDDMWFHTRNTPGGHVLIRHQGAPELIPDEAILAAAQHAASLSKRRNDTRVPVDHTQARYVRRLKGTPPGYVHYTHQKTLNVRPVELRAQPPN